MGISDLAYRVTNFAAKFPKIKKNIKSFTNIQYNIQRNNIFRDLGINLVIDVGANTGQFAADLRNFYDGNIISFEPTSAAFKTLNIKAQQDENWTAYNIACGDENTESSINVSQYSVFSSFLNTNDYCTTKFGVNSASNTTELVKVRRLDTFTNELGLDLKNKNIFLKMDTQGYDLSVFRGIGKLQESICALQSEVSVIPIYNGMPHWTETVSTYEKHGFVICGLYPVNFDGYAAIEFDCLMIKR